MRLPDGFENSSQNVSSIMDISSCIDTSVVNQLRFVDPKNLDTETFLCRAYLGTGKHNLKICLKNVVIAKSSESRKNVHTLYIRPQSKKVVRFFSDFDAHVVQATQKSSADWFSVDMNPSLVEEYYKGSCAVRNDGTHIRTVIEGAIPKSIDPSDTHCPVNIELSLVGIQFRRQYFTAVWKIASASKATPTMSCLFGDDEEDDDPVDSDNDEDNDDGKEDGPPYEERIEIRSELLERLRKEVAHRSTDISRLQSILEDLESSSLTDIRRLDECVEAAEDILGK